MNETEAAIAGKAVKDLTEVINSLAGIVPEAVLSNCQELVDYFEPGVALELLCDRIYESGSPIPRSTLMRLESVGRSMGMDEENWDDLPIE